MSKRLHVLLDDAELAAIQSAARAERVTVAEWVRGALRTACAQSTSPEPKLAAIRQAVRHDCPAGEIDAMLGEIESGYATETSRPAGKARPSR